METIRAIFSKVSFILALMLVFLAYGSIDNKFYRVVTVEGNSMAPTLWYGDLIIVTPPIKIIPINSIILMNVDGSLVVHRVVGYDHTGQPVTKGDANKVIDNFANPNRKVIGIYRFRLPGLGYPLLFLSNLLHSV